VTLRGWGGGEHTGALAVELEEAVEDEAGAHGDADERDGAVAVEAGEDHVGEELAAADGADAGDVERRVDERCAVEDCHRPHRRRREACRQARSHRLPTRRGPESAAPHAGPHVRQSLARGTRLRHSCGIEPQAAHALRGRVVGSGAQEGGSAARALRGGGGHGGGAGRTRDGGVEGELHGLLAGAAGDHLAELLVDLRELLALPHQRHRVACTPPSLPAPRCLHACRRAAGPSCSHRSRRTQVAHAAAAEPLLGVPRTGGNGTQGGLDPVQAAAGR